MFRKLLCSMVVMAVGIGFAAADEFTASIMKIDGGKITYQKFKKVKGKAPEADGDAVTVNAEKAKVKFGATNKDTKKFEATDDVPDGLKNEMFKKIDDKKGVSVRLVFDGDAKDGKLSLIGVTKKKKAAAE